MRLVVNSMPMLKRNPLRLRKFYFKSFHFTHRLLKMACWFRGALVVAESLIGCLRTLELPGQNLIFQCKGTADRKNVKCHWHFRSEGLPAAFRKFSRSFKIGVFRLRSQTSHLPYLLFSPQWQSCTKKVIPTKKLKRLQQKKKNLNQNDYGKLRNKFKRKKGNGQGFTA